MEYYSEQKQKLEEEWKGLNGQRRQISGLRKKRFNKTGKKPEILN